MGTTWSVQTAGVAIDAAVLERDARAALDEVVAQMSHWEAGSEISRFNRAPAGTRMPISADFAAVMTCALKIARISGGAFDPALGEVVEAWGFGPSLTVGQTPVARRSAGWRGLDLNPAGLLQPGDVQLDLSGIAKGYAVDKVAGRLAAGGCGAFLVEVGGELYGAGVTPEGLPWWAQIETPAGLGPTPGGEEIFVGLPGWALATSGDYRRYFERDGRRFSHTIDPATGAPVEGAVASVTVLAADCMRADAWATALTVMGLARGLAFADSHGLSALFLTVGAGGVETHASAAWDQLWAD